MLIRDWGQIMKDQKNKDLETISLFLILGLLTVTLGLIIKLVLFGPGLPQLFEMGLFP
jgi:hypothetical protein